MAIKKIAQKNEVHPYNTNLIENTNEIAQKNEVHPYNTNLIENTNER